MSARIGESEGEKKSASRKRHTGAEEPELRQPFPSAFARPPVTVTAADVEAEPYNRFDHPRRPRPPARRRDKAAGGGVTNMILHPKA